MKIERMTARHLYDVCAIENECFSNPWPRKSLEAQLENGGSLFLVAEENGKAVGYAGMSVVVDEGYIFNVAVTQACRKKGIGSALVNELVVYGKKHGLAFITLEVRESNLAARSLYSGFGFIKAGERKDYYSNPTENAVLMTKFF